MNKLPFRVYEKDEILQLDMQKQDALVEEFLFENDYIILIAKEKMGKSILALQLACSLSSGQPFLDTFRIPKPRMVWYFATEGKDEDLKRRLININKHVKINKDNLMLVCSAGFKFNTKLGDMCIKYLLNKYKDKLPKVIFIDALYLAIDGSLKDDESVNSFTYAVKKFAEACDSAVIIVHHSRRPILHDGKLLDMGDDEIFGSAFLKASVDHCFFMGKVSGTDHKFLKCSTQRSGDIMEEIEINMIEPDPLYFEPVAQHAVEKHKILELLKSYKNGLTIKDLMKKGNISRATLYRTLKEIEDQITKSNTRPAIYSFNLRKIC